ncbi:putative hydroxypyruvate isomerase isoform X3 [Orcinus orca]|uniref:putative hydroxypyruvate isomerase isoform X3 n=1 Tax=Orcinus orca TaxID=9733 RepID=UPI0021121F58|nr:putative hydroxypyruvate isomerase isoform X3 [Orcinus orca]
MGWSRLCCTPRLWAVPGMRRRGTEKENLEVQEGLSERPGEMGIRHDRRAAGRGAPREQRSESSRFEGGLHSPVQAHFPHRIHLMAGRVPQGADRAAVRGEMDTVFLENLRHAAGVLAQGELYSRILPGARRTLWGCWSPSTPASRTPAAAILEKVGRPNLQLQMDIFHWQIMDGNLTGNIREFLPLVGEGPFLGSFLVCHDASSVLPLFLPPPICPHLLPGHVQVAQVPGRGEPGSPGELNFPYLFQLLEDEGYKGFVGCEYQPRGDTVEGLSWLRSYWDKRGRPQAGQ